MDISAIVVLVGTIFLIGAAIMVWKKIIKAVMFLVVAAVVLGGLLIYNGVLASLV